MYCVLRCGDGGGGGGWDLTLQQNGAAVTGDLKMTGTMMQGEAGVKGEEGRIARLYA